MNQVYICKDCQHRMVFEEWIPSECEQCGCRSGTVVYGKERPKSNVFITYDDNPRWSAAMGVNPDQIPEARAMFPDSEYHPQTGDLLIRNRSHKLQEMRRRGYTWDE